VCVAWLVHTIMGAHTLACIFIYTCIHTCIHVYIYAYSYMYVYMYMCICMHRVMCAHTLSCMDLPRCRHTCDCNTRNTLHGFAATPSYVWHDSFLCVAWVIHACDMTRVYAARTWLRLLHMCPFDTHVTHMCTLHGLVDVCDMTRWCVWHDSLMCVTWLVDVCDITRWCVWHDSLMCVT